MSLLSLVIVVVALPVSTAILLLVLAAVWYFDRYDREPLLLVIGTFLWGATAAPLITVVSTGALSASFGLPMSEDVVATVLLPTTLAPFIEELAKALVIVLVALLSRHFDNPADGIVYGTAVGLGFAVTENVLYGLSGALDSSPSQVLLLVVGRTMFSAGVHAVASSLFGGFAGIARLTRGAPARVLWLLVGWIGATGLHAGWNSSLLIVERDHTGAPMVMWTVLLLVLYLSYLLVFTLFLAAEHRILKRELAEEVALGVLPEWVAEVIPYYRRRIRSDWWPRRSERAVIARQITRLAYRKHELRRMDRARAELAGLEVVQLRSKLRAILEFAAENDAADVEV